MKQINLILLLIMVQGLFALSTSELRFLTQKEQFHILQKHPEDILVKALTGNQEELDAILQYAQRADLPGLAMQCHKRLAKESGSLEDALQWFLLKQTSEIDSLEFTRELQDMLNYLKTPLDKQVFSHYAFPDSAIDLGEAIKNAATYNTVIEALAKDKIDEISTARDGSLAIGLIDEFYARFPQSQYTQIALYYSLYHLSAAKDWEGIVQSLPPLETINPVEAYISSLYLMSPTLRKNYTGSLDLLDLAMKYVEKAEINQPQTLLYDVYQASDWMSRVQMHKAKLIYYQLLRDNGFFGDEIVIPPMSKLSKSLQSKLWKELKCVAFTDNDRGELAELNFWKAKSNLLVPGKKAKMTAAKLLTKCLVLGAPRKRYDDDAYQLISNIHKELKIKQPIMNWMRKLSNYKGISFTDISDQAGLTGKGYSRVALADYNSDGLLDILFSGSTLLENSGEMNFTDVTDSVALGNVSGSGGLFADFNKDGKLDFVSYGHADDGSGDKLMKNMDNTRFVNVNERAGDIDDKSPSEAAAWIDTDRKGFPSLYVANYEKWQERSGYPDFFWKNEAGYFSDKSISASFRNPLYTDNPGQAGRGIAPADFDNDGAQEIYVCNYRLNRNFCWKQLDTLFVDLASLYGLAGTFKKGYYGHSIGADWGDFDNDGDLDLFVANLAHPRYLDISDTSMLLRNDGLAYQVIEQDTIYYWQFTDVTQASGITYDELHSDPLFCDFDNDGRLDLFITSVYEGERSYLYRNKGDGTFEDITWLSGARIYNGWGNAAGDLDRDGLPDLVVGSGSGAKILHNRTITVNKALYLKPVWENDTIVLEDNPANFANLPNSPAFGTRVVVTLKSPKGKVFSLIRELSSAKGTGSQNAPELHFGLGRSKLVEIKRWKP